MIEHIEIGNASCTLSSLKEAPLMKAYMLTHLYVAPEHRRKGAAKQLLQQLGRQAEEAGFALLLNPMPFGDTDITEEALITLYESCNYSKIQDEPVKLYCRFPKIFVMDNSAKKQLNTIWTPNKPNGAIKTLN